ncbi:hypothetical protein KNE206_75680 [Kitasatospora sp. NE20-6]|uniref:HtaA domain-containing protein n=1 Tax=Kitasatospora sp. NE20-6 TaxID=2859066 RepID=UPI0034DC204D
MPLSGRPHRQAASLPAALTVFLTAFLLPARAVAAQGQVTGGRLDWGIKQSFLTYVTGPVANGTWALTGGAATTGGSTFRFHSATGTYDPATGALSAGFSGGVHFTGHRENGVDVLDLTISRVTFRAARGGSAGLYADVRSRSRETGRVSTTSQTQLAVLSLAGVDLRGASGTLTLGHVPATLTAAGATAFGGFYTAGTALDPVGLSVNVRSAAAGPAPTTPAATAAPTQAAPTQTAPSGTATGAAPAPTAPRTEFTRGALDWGIRRTFRDYVTGSVAQGRWELARGAADGGAYFRWTPARGGYDPAAGTLTAAFEGSVRFTGMKSGDTYGLDLTLADPAVTVAGGRGTLTADVSGRTPGSGTPWPVHRVELAEFDAAALRAEGGLLKATELPLKLTAAGAGAFGGLYPAGTAMDPLSFAVALDPAAALPPLPDIGSAPAADPVPSPAAAPTAAPSPSAPPAVAVAGAITAVVLAAAGGVLARRHRRRTATATATAPATTAPVPVPVPDGTDLS